MILSMVKNRLKQQKDASTAIRQIPVHIGIIMDGNGRWAKKRGLPRSAGHSAGAETFKKIVRYCSKIGVKYLTVYAFSTENWRRPAAEVTFLMGLFEQYLNDALKDFEQRNIKVVFLGDKSAFSPNLQKLIKDIELVSQSKTGMVLNVAMNYGGRSEIVRAAKEIAADVKDGKLKFEAIDGKVFADKLYTVGQPDPDLIIRPSGEKRLSNFLLWQSAYTEFVFMNVLWPDFSEKDLDLAIDEYAARNRRFGGV